MRILYIGDIMAEPGIKLIEQQLSGLKSEHKVDMVIAQSENVSDGKGLSIEDYQRLRKAGIDGFTGGNHSFRNDSSLPLLSDTNSPVTAPANMEQCPAPGFKYVNNEAGKVLIISLLGSVVGRDADMPTANPLVTIDEILQSQKDEERDATVVNFHGDYSSEKVVVGHYLDGRASLIVGDHWHVPTADARILPGKTAHMTDVGMCGTLNSSLGVTYESILPRWRDNQNTKNQLAIEPPYQLNALLVETDKDGLAKNVTPVQKIFQS